MPTAGPTGAAEHAAEADASESRATDARTQLADYRFVYMGVAGSRTLLHADVLRSFSWSVNIAGRKRWLLLPPEATKLAMDPRGNTLAPSLNPDEVPGWQRRFPRLHQAHEAALKVIQGAGDALFVPSGWHHSVENLEDTISINHNWLNGFNVQHAAQLLQRTFLRGVELLADCR